MRAAAESATPYFRGKESIGLMPKRAGEKSEYERRLAEERRQAKLILRRQDIRHKKLAALDFLSWTYGQVKKLQEERRLFKIPRRLLKFQKDLGPDFWARGKGGVWKLGRVRLKDLDVLAADCRKVLKGFGWEEKYIERKIAEITRRNTYR